MSHYRCTVAGRGDVRWLVEMVRSIRRIPQDAEGFMRVNREALPYFEARLRAALKGKMVFDVVAPGSIVVFTSGCQLTAGRYAQLTPGSRVVCRPNVEQVTL